MINLPREDLALVVAGVVAVAALLVGNQTVALAALAMGGIGKATLGNGTKA